MKSYVYLHGFASSPASSKARYFRDRFAERGLALEIPALDGGDFEHLTISGQLERIEGLLGGGPSVVIGSSLGGYLAALAAVRNTGVEKVVLMAPAFDFANRFGAAIGAKALQDWKASRSLSVYHYKFERQVELDYGLLEDAAQYEGFPAVEQPALVLHGEKDETVPLELSRHFCDLHRQAALCVFDSGHELTDVLPEVWRAAEAFLFGVSS